jgi:hypothetical protein
MAIGPSAGAKVYIGPVTAAATASAYAALTWVEIGGVESVGEFGATSAEVSFTPLSGGLVRKFKGARDPGNVPVVCARDPIDLGQIAAIAAEATKFSYAIKILLEDSADADDVDSIIYFHARVMGKPTNIGGANDLTKRTFSLGIDTLPIEVPSVAS